MCWWCGGWRRRRRTGVASCHVGDDSGGADEPRGLAEGRAVLRWVCGAAPGGGQWWWWVAFVVIDCTRHDHIGRTNQTITRTQCLTRRTRTTPLCLIFFILSEGGYVRKHVSKLRAAVVTPFLVSGGAIYFKGLFKMTHPHTYSQVMSRTQRNRAGARCGWVFLNITTLC